MNKALFTLGGVEFTQEERPISNISEDIDYVWAVMERLGLENSLQATGVGNKNVTLNGVTFPIGISKANPAGLKQIQELDEMASEQIPLPLIDGMGNYHGFFAIRKISEDKTDFLRTGAHLSSTYTLALTRYPMDTTGSDGLVSDGSFEMSKYKEKLKPFMAKISTLFN